ncbi:MAG: P22 phage major capsid protein family protein [Hyphomonadaceae bacterium]
MANTFTALIPKIIAQGLMTLRETCLMPQLVWTDFKDEVRKVGDTIDFPLPSPQAATDVEPGPTPPTNVDKTIETVPLKLDKWKKTFFHLTDKELGEIESNKFRGMQVQEAARALANKINADILAEYKGIYGYVGTAGTTPFATTTAAATDARKVLARQLCPKPMRKGILNADAEANALSLAAFQDVDKAGTDLTKREGEIGRKFGIDWFMEDAVPTHTAGTITTGLIAKAATAVAAGLKTFLATTAASTGACALVVGDVIAIAGHTTTYVLTAAATQASAASDVALAFEPGLEKPLVGSEAITVKASHVANLVFHPQAFGFANRKIDGEAFKGGNAFGQIVDPVSGIALALEVERQHFQTTWYFSVLYGCKLLRRELGCRIAG